MGFCHDLVHMIQTIFYLSWTGLQIGFVAGFEWRPVFGRCGGMWLEIDIEDQFTQLNLIAIIDHLRGVWGNFLTI